MYDPSYKVQEMLIFAVSYNHGQDIWGGVNRSSKIG